MMKFFIFIILSFGNLVEPFMIPKALAHPLLNVIDKRVGNTRGNIGNLITTGLELAGAHGAATLLNTFYVDKREDDYPYIRPSSFEAAGGYACFPNTALIYTPLGAKSMGDLHIGDEVLVDVNKETDSPVYNKVLYFLHQNSVTAGITWFKIYYVTEKNSDTILSITLSENHMLFKYDSQGNIKASAAKNIKLHDYIHVYGSKGKTVNIAKTYISPNTLGLYAPVTISGKLIVDNVYVSAYSTIPNTAPMFDHFINDVITFILWPTNLLLSTFQNHSQESLLLLKYLFIQNVWFPIKLTLKL